jgi:hypothetical protein
MRGSGQAVAISTKYLVKNLTIENVYIHHGWSEK